MKKLLFAAMLLLGAVGGWSDQYWVSPTGASTWANAKSVTPLTGSSCCTYSTANTNATADDTVNYRTGTYTGLISPANSGISGHLIVFKNYNNEDVIFENGSYAINLNCDVTRGGSSNKRAYIKVSGSSGHPITFNNFNHQLWILKTDHIEVTYCKFYGMYNDPEPQGTYIYVDVTYCWIHNNIFRYFGSCEPYGTDAGGPFQMGINDADDHGTQYNLVENNDMSQGGHHVAWLGGTYNIYRNNYFHNEPWCPIGTPTFATRLLIQSGYGDGAGNNIDGIHNLNEGNRIGYGGPKNKVETGGNVAQVMGEWNIWRYNIWAQSYLSSIWLYDYNDYEEITEYNHIYNNNFWKGGYGYYQDYYDPRATAPTGNWSKSFHHPINIEPDALVANNTFKNNLFYQNNTMGTYAIGKDSNFVTESDSYDATGPNRQNISHNWTNNSSDPKFTDISAAADPTIDPATLWNFNLQSSSTAIDGGTYLATANGAGNNSTSLVLNTETKDAYPASMFFYDVGNIAAAYPTANVNNDWIAIGTVSNTVQISSINYSTNTITLVSPKTWSNGASIWLYKKSDGVIVLQGTAPDYGAYEYNNSTSSQPYMSIKVSR
jgi:hypothetical protein